ncbi:MAG: peptidylprolyl isomerase [Pararhodobacter sp.]|nr:peptidylprolyl isomerase [Pararhodobacter sp.]
MRRRDLLGAALALMLAPMLAPMLTPILAPILAPTPAFADEGGAAMPILEIDVAGQANGTIRIGLRPDLAPGHVQRIIDLAQADAYDGVVFHRVIDGFMAQTGDVQFGRRGADTQRAGMGGSDLADLRAEFSTAPFERGVMGMARSQSPHSANSQFFLMFAPAPHLNGQYTVLGEIIDGFDVLDAIRRGRGANGAMLDEPDYMADVRVVMPAADGEVAPASE